MSYDKKYILQRDFNIGEVASMSKIFTEKDIESFASISKDYNPVHIDARFATKTRFKGKIVHGILVAGLVSATLGTKLPGPGCIYINQNLNFLVPVRIGDEITAVVTVTKWKPDKKIIILDTKCTNQKGEIVLKGEAVLLHEPPE